MHADPMEGFDEHLLPAGAEEMCIGHRQRGSRVFGGGASP